jgi:hypothetical protein
MSWIRRFSLFSAVIAVVALLATSALAEDKTEKPVKPKDAARPKIQMAILLDTSSSMAGLLNQARSQLWTIANQFADAKRGGVRPEVQVALLEFGAGRLSEESEWTRVVVPLTTNLDKISEELNALTAVGRRGGSNEYCGKIISVAISKLKWSDSPKDLKCIFIAGNESFAQGPVDYHKACRAAADQGVTVSTIFCGSANEGLRLGWKEGADLADGSYTNIDANQRVVVIAAPQDAELAKLSGELNKTYLAYGRKERRAEFADRQAAQDDVAAKASPAVASARARTKGSALYRFGDADLVDGIAAGRVKLENVKEDQLPEQLRKMKPAERKAHVEKMAKRRKEIQQKIAELSKQRDKHITDARKKLVGKRGPKSLNEALGESIRKQAEKKNFDLKPATP